MRDFSIKYRHIQENKDIGIKNLLATVDRIICKTIAPGQFFPYTIEGVCDLIGRIAGTGEIVTVLKGHTYPWVGEEALISDIQKILMFVDEYESKQSGKTLKNIVESYNKAMTGLVKDVMKELPKYFKPGSYKDVDLGKWGKGFGRKGDEYYIIRHNGEELDWFNEKLSDKDRMDIYIILSDKIY